MAQERVSVLFDAPDIQARVIALSQDIRARVPADVVIVGLLKGAFVFVADLVRALSTQGMHPEVEFLTLSSYGARRESSGKVELVGQVPARISGRPALLVDDVVDTGRSLLFAKELLSRQGAGPTYCCALIDKPGRREVVMKPEFIGFTVGDEFVVGYGIDLAGKYRELPFIGAVR